MSNNSRKPLIGVSGCRKDIEGHPFDCAGRKYTRAIELACDAMPLIIPATGDALDRASLLARVDGLLFTGSHSNVDPSLYGNDVSVDETLHDPHRDATTLPLIREAVDAGVPVLCICRGFQEMNVAFGGTLQQQVHEVPGMLDHRENPDLELDPRYAPVHSVEINRAGIFGDLDPEIAQVNSLHGQGIDTLADALVVEATAPDGLIEAVSVRNAESFATGVQWHPEWKVMEHPFYLALFKKFAEACRDFMDKRQRKV